MNVIASVFYRRVSTDHQDNSLVVQESFNDEYFRRLIQTGGSESYADDDTSGSIPMRDRPGGRALLNRLKHGDIKHVITSKQDRLGRDTLDQIATIRTIWDLGITPHFTYEGGALPRNPQNEMLFEIKASVAQYERNQIRDRVRLSARHKFIRFELTGKVPYGYDVRYEFTDGHKETSAAALCWGSKDQPPEARAQELLLAHGALLRKPLISNEAEQAIIRRMAVMRQSLSLKAIADTLNAQGIRTKLGKPWQCGSVDGVLSSRHTARLLQSDSDQLKAAA